MRACQIIDTRRIRKIIQKVIYARDKKRFFFLVGLVLSTGVFGDNSTLVPPTPPEITCFFVTRVLTLVLYTMWPIVVLLCAHIARCSHFGPSSLQARARRPCHRFGSMLEASALGLGPPLPHNDYVTLVEVSCKFHLKHSLTGELGAALPGVGNTLHFHTDGAAYVNGCNFKAAWAKDFMRLSLHKCTSTGELQVLDRDTGTSWKAAEGKPHSARYPAIPFVLGKQVAWKCYSVGVPIDGASLFWEMRHIQYSLEHRSEACKSAE